MSLVERDHLAFSHPRRLALRLSLIVAAVGIACALYGRIMGYDLRRDEFMFLPPAVLLDDHALYAQLFYNHVPYSAWLFRAVHLLLPDLGLVQAGRLAVFAAWLMLLAVAGWLGWRLTRSPVVAAFCVISLLTADVLLGQTGMAASNNLLPLPFALLGLGLVSVSLVERDLSFPRLFAAGLVLSIAAGLKVSAFAVIPAVAVACFLLPRDLSLGQRARRVALPVALGGLVGALPLIWLALTMPDLFFAHILGYHVGPHVAFWQANAASEPGVALNGGQKLLLAQTIWLSGASMLALFVTAIALMLGGRNIPDAVVMVAVAIACAAAVGFAPSPGFPQYYAMPLIGVPLLTALACSRMALTAQRSLSPILILAAAAMLLLALPRLAVGLNDLRQPDRLTHARVAAGAQALYDAMAAAGVAQAGPVATLSPLYPIQAGLPIYAEFAAGPFAYRVADVTQPDLRALYVMAGPRDLDALFRTTPPAAFLTGFDATLEAPLIDYARRNGFHPVDLPALADRYGNGTLWLPSAPLDTSTLSGESL